MLRHERKHVSGEFAYISDQGVAALPVESGSEDNALAAHMGTYFLIKLCCESENCTTSQAASDRQQNVQWRGLLQVSVWYEQQSRPLMHSKDFPASSRFEREA